MTPVADVGGFNWIVAAGSVAFALTCTTVAVKRFGLWARFVGRRTVAYRKAFVLLVDGDPHATPPVPPLPARLDTHDARLAALSGDVNDLRALCAELIPNGGASFRDEYRRDMARMFDAITALERRS